MATYLRVETMGRFLIQPFYLHSHRDYYGNDEEDVADFGTILEHDVECFVVMLRQQRRLNQQQKASTRYRLLEYIYI